METSDIDPQRQGAFVRRLAEWPEEGKRIPLGRLLAVFNEEFPHRPRETEQRRWLLAALRDAEKQNIVQFPSPSGNCWDCRLNPALPSFVTRILQQSEIRHQGWKSFPWTPRLSWVRDLSRLDPADERMLYKVHKGMVNHHFDQIAPLKYRSLQLTGQEKRLGQMKDSALFLPGRLDLALLGCAEDYPPIVCESINDLPTLIIFENASLMRVALGILRGMTASPYGMAGYGGGSQFAQSVRHLATIRRPVSRIDYVGDMDSRGLEIPQQASVNAQAAGLPPITPAPGAHRAMLNAVSAFGHPEGLPHGSYKAARLNRARLAWLPPDVQDSVWHILAAGNRVPEELLGPDEMRRLWSASAGENS